MPFRPLKVVVSVDRVEPDIKEELRPLSSSQDKAVDHQTFSILRQNEVDFLSFQPGERLNHAVRWNDRHVLQHQVFEALCVHDVLFYRHVVVHDQRLTVCEEEVGRLGVEGHGVSHGGDFCPGGWGVIDGVVCYRGEECCVA